MNNGVAVKNMEEESTQVKIIIQNKIDYIPKVSVIIPVYNTEKYLCECLDNVINQTLKEIEIICIDDGSTDNSFEILKEYATKDSRFVILQQKNMGAGIARNGGIETAKGEFLAFLDADDYYNDIDVLENLYENAKKNTVLICGGSFAELRQDGVIFSDWENTKEFGYFFDTNKLIKYDDWQFDFGYTRFIYKRSFLIEKNILFDNKKYFEDPVFFVKAMTYAKEFYAIKRTTYWYRVGYKKIKWNYNKILDLLNGILENLSFSKANNFTLLNKVTTERFLFDYSHEIVKYLNNDFAKNKIESIYSNILLSSLQKDIITNYLLLKRELVSVRQSLSFRIGEKIMFIPCLIRDLFLLK